MESISCPKTFSEWKLAGCKQSYRDLKAKILKINISFLFSVIYNFFVWPLKIWYVYYFTHSIGCTKQFSEGKSVGCKQSYRGLKAKGRDFTGYFNLSGSVFTTSWRHRVEVGGERGGHWFWLGVPPTGLANSSWYRGIPIAWGYMVILVRLVLFMRSPEAVTTCCVGCWGEGSFYFIFGWGHCWHSNKGALTLTPPLYLYLG